MCAEFVSVYTHFKNARAACWKYCTLDKVVLFLQHVL